MNYSEKLRDPRWQKRRLDILQRDNFTCRECQSDKKELHVHHRYYVSKRDPWAYNDCALVTLCKDCHSQKRGELEGFEFLLVETFSAYDPDSTWYHLSSLLKRLRGTEDLSPTEAEIDSLVILLQGLALSKERRVV